MSTDKKPTITAQIVAWAVTLGVVACVVLGVVALAKAVL